MQLKQKYGLKDRQPVIGTVGRLVAEKGQACLIESLSEIKADFPDLICLFVGQGPLLEPLKQAALTAGVWDMCRFTGPVDQIEDIYAMLDLFVLPSLREPFGLAILEAMASGVAVLATDAGGPSAYIRSGVNGLLVPPEDPAAMAAGIMQMLSDRLFREEIAETGRQTVTERFDIIKTVQKIEAVYSSL